MVPVENQLVARLRQAGWTLATAESMTAGAVANRLCTCPGTEEHVLGGVVSYATVAKRDVLGISADRVVTAEAAVQMARAARDLFGATAGLAVTGVAGPDRQEDRPVGTVFVGWCTPAGEGSEQLAGAGTPEQIRREATDQAVRLLLSVVRRYEARRD